MPAIVAWVSWRDRENVVHCALVGGTAYDGLLELTGAAVTSCGRTVPPLERLENELPTCEACRADRARRIEGLVEDWTEAGDAR